MKTLQDFNFSGKRVLVRCDFNAPIRQGFVLDDFRLQRALKTITFLKRQGAKIVLMSHLSAADQEDKVVGEKEGFFGSLGLFGDGKKEKLSLEPVQRRLTELLRDKVLFSRQIIGKNVQRQIGNMKSGEVLLLENLRFCKGEEKNEEGFAKALAQLGDFYVAECFSVCHRSHASVAILPRLLPNCAGFELTEEVRVLSGLSQKPQRPFVVIIGGAKVESKMRVVEKFMNIADHLLLGGKLANLILRVKGLCVGRTWPDEELTARIKQIDLTNPKIHLPVDAIVSSEPSGETYTRQTAPALVRQEEDVYDIGPDTVEHFSRIIEEARLVFWSGPLGLVEQEKFREGTYGVARAILRNKETFSVVGGGDTVAALKKVNFLQDFSYISVGGGAMLSFLVGEKMPGLEALQD